MRATGLPARLLYTMLATPLAGAGGFYFGILLLSRVIPHLHGLPAQETGWVQFVLSVLLGAALGFTAFWWALTLPRLRRRLRVGRGWRISVSALVVLAGSVIPAAEGVPLRYVFGLAVWLALVLMGTFIRYGLRDSDPRSRRGKARDYSGVRSTR